MPKSSTPKTVESTYGIAAIEAGLRVLEIVSERPNLSSAELSELTGMTRTKVFRVLRTLEALGYVTLQKDRRAVLGRSAYLLGRRAEQQYSLVQAARSVMDELAAESQENVHLVIREGLHSLVVDLRESNQPVRMYAEIGRRGPLHAGGSPKVLLAHAPAQIIAEVLSGELVRYTAQTVTEPAQLERTLADIRGLGYHTALSDLDDGTYSVAAPIYNDEGEVTASISLAGPLMRWNDTVQQTFEERIVEASRAISQELGWSPG